MPANYVLLERIELNASAASVTFSNIPQTGYTDLKVVMSARTDTNDGSSGQWGYVNFNGASTNNSTRILYGTGSGTGSFTGSSPTPYGAYVEPSNFTSSTFSNSEVYIPNYTSSNNKSYSIDSVTENNATGAYSNLTAGLWSSSAAITSVVISPAAGNFVQYSTFSLYGLAAVGSTPAIAPKASGGNITTDGTYWYHTFLASGTFTPQISLSCDALVVAGAGAGGGGGRGGGGGAGGLLALTSQSVTATGYTVTVGAGGAAITDQRGNSGSNSAFNSGTAIGGGGGGGRTSTENGANGGSGGGAATGSGGAPGTAGTGTSGQGNNGGAGSNSAGPNYGAGGGGGAGAVGGTGTSLVGGNGGVGSSAYSSWGSATVTGQNVSGTYYYAGGGGGGAWTGNTASSSGGYGGGGSGRDTTGGVNANGDAGTTNTGGGGGASSETGKAGGNGGSGIVIIRYAV